MSSDYREFLEAICVPAVLAAVGGIVRCLRFGAESWRQFMGSMVVSAFTGVVIHLIIYDMDLSPSLKAAIVATSGYSGGAILDAIIGRIIQSVNSLPGPGRLGASGARPWPPVAEKETEEKKDRSDG